MQWAHGYSGCIGVASTGCQAASRSVDDRLQGELLARASRDQIGNAQAAFRAAISIARQQGAGMLKGKAEESLRHWVKRSCGH
jgi:hypothetical protein